MKRIYKCISVLSIMLLILLTSFPIFYVVSHSLKGETLINLYYTNPDISVWNKVFIKPFYINLDQFYRILFRTPEFLYLFWNSCIVTIPIVGLQTILAIFAAYGFSKAKFWGSQVLFYIYIVIMLMPFQVTLVPNYITLSKLNLIDKYLGLILPGAFGTFGVFFLKQFMEGINNAFIEEAKLLGANEFQIIIYIIVPMCKQIIVSVIFLLFIDYWSMIEQPLIFIKSINKYPLSVYLSTIAEKNIGIGFACSILYMLLPILMTLYVQSDLSDSLKITSLK